MMKNNSSDWCIFFKAVHDKHRQDILHLLKRRKELNATQVLEKIKLSQPTVSHHLKILLQAGLISAEKRGKNVIYSLDRTNKAHINKCCRGFMRRFSSLKIK